MNIFKPKTFRISSFSTSSKINSKNLKSQLLKLPDPLISVGRPVNGFALFVKESFQKVTNTNNSTEGGTTTITSKTNFSNSIKEFASIWNGNESIRNDFNQKAKTANAQSLIKTKSLYDSLSVYDHLILGRRLEILKKLKKRISVPLPDLIFKKKRTSGRQEYVKEYLSLSTEDLASRLGLGVGNVGSMSIPEKFKAVALKYSSLSESERKVYDEKAAASVQKFNSFLASQDQELIKKATETISSVRKEVLKKDGLIAKKKADAKKKALKKKKADAKKKTLIKKKADAKKKALIKKETAAKKKISKSSPKIKKATKKIKKVVKI